VDRNAFHGSEKDFDRWLEGHGVPTPSS